MGRGGAREGEGRGLGEGAHEMNVEAEISLQTPKLRNSETPKLRSRHYELYRTQEKSPSDLISDVSDVLGTPSWMGGTCHNGQ